MLKLGTPVTEARNVLASKVEDTASGFKGEAIGIILHLNGCIHINVQPPGTVPDSGEAISTHDFDIRRLKGPKIPKLTENEKAARSPGPVAPLARRFNQPSRSARR